MQITDFNFPPLSNLGKGPKDFVRSDDRIMEDIGIILTVDPFIDASNLSISVKGGEVTVTGSNIDHPLLKLRLQQLIASVFGVKAINFSEEPKENPQ